jgi:hypothetical protein
MGNITLNGATSGQITLSPTAVAGTNTITLPAATGTVLTTAGGQTISGTTTVSNLAMNGSSSGTTTLSPSATASGTITLPAGTGTVAVQGVSTNIVSATSVTPTNGSTSVSFTGIPSWVKRITMSIAGVNGTFSANTSITLGTGATPTYASSGYVGVYISQATSQQIVSSTYFALNVLAPTIGNIVFVNTGSNYWTATGITSSGSSGGNQLGSFTGYINLGATLTAIKLSTTSTDTFNGTGLVNILYE